MGFTTSCFIKIDAERDYNFWYNICLYLRNLGYEGVQNDSMRYVDSTLNVAIQNSLRNKSTFSYLIANRSSMSILSHISIRNIKKLGVIECQTNTQFKAISALRDDSDYMQWFVLKDDGSDLEDWVLCNTEICEYPSGFRKATVEELIEHFK